MKINFKLDFPHKKDKTEQKETLNLPLFMKSGRKYYSGVMTSKFNVGL